MFEHAFWLAPATLDDVRVLMALVTERWTPPRIEDALLQQAFDEDGSWMWNRDTMDSSAAWLIADAQWGELHFQHDDRCDSN